eukprot:Sdes_comp17975_c0_seq2m7231
MVKLFSIMIFHKSGNQVRELACETDLQSFGFFQRSSIGEFMTFISKTLAERTCAGNRQTVEENEYHCHVHARSDNLAAVLISDKDYPTRVAFSLITKLIEEFIATFPRNLWGSPSSKPKDFPFPPLREYLIKYQDPTKADNLAKVQAELDETKIILHKTIEGNHFILLFDGFIGLL